MKPKSILDEYYTEEEMSRLLEKKLTTLTKDRCMRQGPPFRKIGGKPYYPRKEFEIWVNAQPLVWGKGGKLHASR